MDGLELTAPAPRDQNPHFDDTGSLWHRYLVPCRKIELKRLTLHQPRNPTFDVGLHARANS